jgi:PAS domain S-box-containing protein
VEKINSNQVEAFFKAHRQKIYRSTDRMFAVLMILQWVAGIVIASLISPLAWSGEKSSIHPHVWTAVFFGGVLSALPVFLALWCPGKAITRYTISFCQLMISGLLIHLTDGRIETHFHIFGSLAFLSFYRDWRVLIPATIVTVLDHIFRGVFLPSSVYGVLAGAEWRWLEHAGWVIFEDIFLIASCHFSAKEMWESAVHITRIENSEARFRAVVEQTTEGIFLLSPETRTIIECNESFAKLIGYEQSEIANLSVYDFEIQEEGETEVIAALVQIGDHPVETERKFRTRDGSIVYVDILGRSINYNGSIAYCLNVRDITERKKNEEETRRLALVAQKTQNGVIITDRTGRIEWVNAGFSRISGYPLEEIIGRTPGDLLNGENTDPETVKALQEAMRNRARFEGEIYSYHKDGAGYWISLSIAPLHNDDGTHQGFIFLGADTTDRKNMEEELRQARDEMEYRVSERTIEFVDANRVMRKEVEERKLTEAKFAVAQEFLRSVIDNVPNMIFVKDHNGRYKLANRPLAELYGFEIDELIGKTDAELIANNANAETFSFEDRHILEESDERLIFEQQFTDRKGKVHWLHTVKRPLYGGVGKMDMLGIATDLTDRKTLEGQLRHAQKLESIGQLAAGIAHEINTPTQYVGDNTRFLRDAFTDINQVMGKYAELYKAARAGEIKPELIDEVETKINSADLDFLTEEIPSAIQQSLDGVSRIAKIVQSMKDFAHPGTKEKSAADINKAIESTVTVARNEWKYVADLKTDFDSSLPPVPCMLGEFNQVILNMVTNASHAIINAFGEGTEHKGKIVITTTKVGNEWAEIRIADNGSGIPVEAQKRVFDPFFTTKEVGKGTGQGLAISHTVIVDQHNGKLYFETEPGQGTTFIIRLPLQLDKKPEVSIREVSA